MRKVFIDVATTGLYFEDRIIEMAWTEYRVNRESEIFHTWVCPDGSQMIEAVKDVCGYDDAFLIDKPAFGMAVEPLLKMLNGANLYCWNEFDLRVINNELLRADYRPLSTYINKSTNLHKTIKSKFPDVGFSYNRICQKMKIDSNHQSGTPFTVSRIKKIIQIYHALQNRAFTAKQAASTD